jgi:two-component system, chemotaxis family, chemotaxis protein CheY
MLNVLVVDDDADLRAALAEGLGAHGYTVALATDGADALAKLDAGARPDAIVLDLGMPRINGWQFRDLQKRAPALAGIPVLVLTGEPSPLGIDARNVLPKPVELDHLAAAIRRVAGSASGS